ncbi:MAG TPA: C-terminal binding protein [bacterium]|nr:C-terminal binding protein [bacterium]
MAETRLVLWTEGESGPRFRLDTKEIEAAGGVFRSVSCRSEADLVAAAREARVLVVSAARITDTVLAGAPRLVGIVRTGVGLDTIDIPAATRHGVCVAYVPDFCYDEVADATWALILAVSRKVVLADRHVRSGGWAPSTLQPMHTLRGQTLGLVAFGNIARKVAERARGFGLRVVAVDPHVDAATMEAMGVEKVEPDELLARADIVSLHPPLTSETRGMIGAAAFARMKPGAILINASRGGVVDQEALIAALRSGRLGGAGLDVQTPEPPAKDNPLHQMDNVVLTPHYASTTVEAMQELAEKVGRQAAQLLRGEWPTYLANPAVREQPGCRLLVGEGVAQ